MNPLSLEGTTMVPTSAIRSFFRALTTRSRRGTRGGASHPDNVSSDLLQLPRRIDDPSSAAHLADDLLRNHREDITLALYLDDRHRLVGTAILTVGWVEAARLSARPILFGAKACQARSCVLARYGRYRGLAATEQEMRSFDSIAAACSRYGVVVTDHLVVVGSGQHRSSFQNGP
jgi:DNA repair protein RadC